MVDVITGNPTTCAGGNHLHLPVTVKGRQIEFTYDIAELREAADINSLEELRAALKVLLVSAIKASGATTNPQRRAAIANKTFTV